MGRAGRATAIRYAGLLLALTTACGMVVGLVVWAVGPSVLLFYEVSAQATAYAQGIIVFLSLGVWVRASNFIHFVGILRTGGDTHFAFVLDAGSIWLVGVTLALLGAFALHWPVPLVYLLTLGDELFKGCIVFGRFASGKWIHRLAQGPA